MSHTVFFIFHEIVYIKKTPEDLIKRKPVASYMQQWQVTACFK